MLCVCVCLKGSQMICHENCNMQTKEDILMGWLVFAIYGWVGCGVFGTPDVNVMLQVVRSISINIHVSIYYIYG